MKKIIIAGGSGFVGTNLTQKLLDKNYQILILDLSPSRLNHPNLAFQKINLMLEEIPTEFINNSHAVINLAGIPIFGRFTPKYKKLIYDSRIKTTTHIKNAIAKSSQKPKILINASAIGYYGNGHEILLNEENPNGNDFLAHVCKDWEEEANKTKSDDTKVAILRTAHVIGKGGLANVLKNLFQKQIGGYFGTGRQYMPWISINDLTDLYIYLLENEIEGIFNASAENLTQKEFMNIFRKNYNALILWKIPKIFGYLLYGEFIDSLVGGQKINNIKIKNTGFIFKDNNLKDLLKEI